MATVRNEPQSFNRLAAPPDSTAILVSHTLTQAPLVRINPLSDDVEPWLAASWSRGADGRTYILALRQDVTYSDGHPFTSADVLFTFRALYDPSLGSTLADSMKVDGQPLAVAAPDDHTVVITFPVLYGPGVRILAPLPILPRHKLEAALEAGTFPSAWGMGTTGSDFAGLGPFVPAGYEPGQRVRLARNPRYWRTAPTGASLPYLDGITLEVVPNQDAELLRLEAGESDATASAIRPADYAPLRRAADAGRVQLFDLGVGLTADSLWFNLRPGAFAGDPRAAWIQRDELRQAISLAVDRPAFADQVYFGAAVPVFGFVTPANAKWYLDTTPEVPLDLDAARARLAAIGLTDRDGDGQIEDAAGRAARFTLLVQRGRTDVERGADFLRGELRKLGLTMDVAALEPNVLIQRFVSGRDYDAVLFSVEATDTDPAGNLDFWRSSGAAHVWNMNQSEPATDWERRIDDLMAAQVTSEDDAERQRLFDEVQTVMAEHLPVLNFAAPRVYVAASARLRDLQPAISRPQLLWAADSIAIAVE